MTADKLESEGAAYIERFLSQHGEKKTASKAEGAELASRLRTHAIDLCHNKATEFSPAIGRLFELAAKVALQAHWPDEEALALYERDVASTYGKTERSTKHAHNYEQFRREYLKSVS